MQIWFDLVKHCMLVGGLSPIHIFISSYAYTLCKIRIPVN